jgi:hypothetical protein
MLMGELLTAKGEVWRTIAGYLSEQYGVMVKQEDLTLGYLFSSVA